MATTRRQRRKIFIIAVLVLLLLLLAAYFAYFRSTKQLSMSGIVGGVSDTISVPQFLYSFSGPEADRLERPIGVFVDDKAAEVYVSDTRKGKVYVFDLDGKVKRTIGGQEILVPLYIAKHPKDGKIYVTDRRRRTIHIYEPSGKFIKDFDPKLPEAELPDFETNGVQWAPVALAFGKDGTMYVTEILNGHRMLIFAPDGTFKDSVGTAGVVTDAKASPEIFQFPNSIKVQGENVWVADSNNRRIQVFDLAGKFDCILPTTGLPRGLDFLSASTENSGTAKMVVVDTLAHDSTIWNVKGEKLVNFGEQGVLEGQFNYPNGVSIGPRNLIFIADSANGRIQVWGWPEQVSAVPLPEVAQYWRWCFAPLLLLPLLLLLRRKKFFVTEEFINAMIALELVDRMPARRRTWLVTEQVYEVFKEVRVADIDLGELLHSTEHSESDAKALMDRLELDHETAVIIAIAKRAHVFCTDDTELRRIAKVLEVDVVDHDEFLERYGKTNGGTEPTNGSES